MSRASRLALAVADHTAPDLLKQLATDEDAEVRRAVASNPNTPQDVLLKLGKEFPDAIVTNPIFNILLLENPESLFVRLSLARSSSSPSETLANLSALPDEDILCAIAENPNTPVATLEQLVQNPPQIYDYDHDYDGLDGSEFGRLLTSVAKNPNTPASLLIQLANHSSHFVRYAVAEHPHTPANILDRFADFRDMEMHRAILRNSSTPATVLEKLAGEEVKEIRDRIKAHPNVSEMAIALVDFMDEKPETPLHLLPTFATHSRPAVRRLVADYPHTPPSVLDRLSLDMDDGVRHKVGEHPNASATALEHVAEWLVVRHQQSPPSNRQSYEHSAIALVKRSNITSKILETLLKMGVIKVAVAIAACKAAPPETLLKFIESEEQFQEPSFWSILAGNPNTPVEGLEILFSRIEQATSDLIGSYRISNSRASGRYNIASHPNVSVQLLKKLASRCPQDPNLCSLMLKNPNLSGELLRWLASHPDIRETYNAEPLIAEHPNTPIDLLLRFVVHPSPYVRQGLASNTNAPAVILETLADDEDEFVRAKLLANPSVPGYILERFARNIQDERICESLINNPKTPAKLLEVLLDTSNRKWYQKIATHPNTSLDCIIKLATDRDYLVWQDILQRNDLTETVLETLAITIFTQAENQKLQYVGDTRIPACGNSLIDIAKHPKTPVHILEKLAMNQPKTLYKKCNGAAIFLAIRKAIASNISTPIAILEQLTKDDQEDVRAAARKMLKEKL
ncbi:hypothetical protein IQ264_26195 [Phormidium sp. LEGE 05292]|uniref:hypothetical protein n=1 Tax=[Phormidium] sp. LEGE 05292 TaxID=767427 RepID=UPI00188032C5|nr:hypothetical protein [Phormidium sp. LEGE 05292]MBE9228907.1 hypothetical protein [Phormidium sp. LEGE 05292]